MKPRKPKKATSKAAARKKLALSKETLKDLTARGRAKGVRGGERVLCPFAYSSF